MMIMMMMRRRRMKIYTASGHAYRRVSTDYAFRSQCISLSQRVVNVWNKLAASVVEATSVNTFKKRLHEWMDVEL